MQQVVAKPVAMSRPDPAAGTSQIPDLATREPKPSVDSPRQILVVDDEPMVRDVTRRMLESAGWRSMTAPDGQEALKLVGGEPSIAAVVLDVTMPRMNGLELCRLIRQLRPTMPVVLCSGYGSDAVAHDLLSARPPLQFVHKPFTIENLLTSIRLAINPDGEPVHVSSFASEDPSPRPKGS
jgi:two-component system cell cycle sensor histidine kinase/response regulator CckA